MDENIKISITTTDFNNVIIDENLKCLNGVFSENIDYYRNHFVDTFQEINNKNIKYIENKFPELFIIGNHENSCDYDRDDLSVFKMYDDNGIFKFLTNDIVGFIGKNNCMINIDSRFAKDGEDYFLHYMLSKVFSFNILDLKHSSKEDSSFSFYIYLFKDFFMKAIKQGIYKKYEKFEYNDSKLKGVIDFNRHIKNNIPFNGKIAYSTREHSLDNNITQLIRHTIEYIERETSCGYLLKDKDIAKDISVIKYITSNYSKNSRKQIVNKNLKNLSHPYYYEYENLRKICLLILKQEDLKYGDGSNNVYGILIRSSWLWEQYIDTILSEMNFKHPRNDKNTDGVCLLDNAWKVYPDFYSKEIVIDTKYKTYKNLTKIDRNDKLQILAYMYGLKSSYGFFLCPREDNAVNTESEETEVELIKVRNNDSYVGLLLFSVPNKTFDNKPIDNMTNFIKEIELSEENLKNQIKKLHEKIGN